MKEKVFFRMSFLREKKIMVCIIIIAIFAFLGIFGPFFVEDPLKFSGRPLESPSWKHLLGTDLYGRDLFSWLVHGIRNSMMVGMIAGGISLSIAIMLGGLSGYLRGLIGEIFNAIINIFLVIPTVPLLIILSTLTKERSLVTVALFIGFVTAWPGSARAIRAQVLSLREKEFVNLAKLTGKSSINIVLGEIFPNMLSYILLQYCGAFAHAMLAETGISLIGLGPVNIPTLGTMMHWAIRNLSILLGIWWWFIPPGLTLMILSGTLYTLSVVYKG
jgi:peptide/nickel transport system permease protein